MNCPANAHEVDPEARARVRTRCTPTSCQPRARVGLGKVGRPWADGLAIALLVAGAIGCEEHVVIQGQSFLQDDDTVSEQGGAPGLPGLGSVGSAGADSSATGGADAEAGGMSGASMPAETQPGQAGGSGATPVAGAGGTGIAGAPPTVDACVGVLCDDGIACTVDGCVPSTGRCTIDATACECSVASQLTDCEDNDPCTLDRCVDFACSNVVTPGQACDDGMECTSQDLCRADGSCAGEPDGCEPPDEWICDADSYGDDQCDCGCGAVDIDCGDASVESCESCQCSTCTEADAACADGACPVLPTNNAQCGWECPAFLYSDGVCTCGCGVVDPDCASDAAEACDVSLCNPTVLGGAGVLATNNALCLNEPSPDVPEGWTCSPHFFDNGVCDCGCGALDSDCGNRARAQCEFCACADVAPVFCPVPALDNTLCQP